MLEGASDTILFILSLNLIKKGAEPLAPWIRNNASIDSPASALGFGWLTASVALSGSPVAAAALSFLEAHVLNPKETFAMIAGSRLGAAFLVLVLGFLYIIRGRQRNISLGIGLLSLLVTQTIYPFVLVIGYLLLSTNISLPLLVNSDSSSLIEQILTPVIDLINKVVPPEGLLIFGFLLVLFSLWLFDKIVPDLDLKDTELGMLPRLLYRPFVVFLFGALLTTLTMSVSVSLSLLLPLSVRGYIRQENVIPYIFGANITTFVDTLIAAVLLSNPTAVTIVLIQMISVSMVTVVILLTSLRPYERFIQFLARSIGSKNIYVLIYIILILGIPIGLIWIG